MKNGRPRPDLKDIRRKEAKERQEKRNKRTSKEQIAKLDRGGYVAEKERLRLINGEKQ